MVHKLPQMFGIAEQSCECAFACQGGRVYSKNPVALGRKRKSIWSLHLHRLSGSRVNGCGSRWIAAERGQKEGCLFGGFGSLARLVPSADGIEVEKSLPAGSGDKGHGEQGIGKLVGSGVNPSWFLFKVLGSGKGPSDDGGTAFPRDCGKLEIDNIGIGDSAGGYVTEKGAVCPEIKSAIK